MTYPSTRTSKDYTAAVKICPDGKVFKANCKRTSIMDAQTARAALSGGRVAFVAPDVYDAEFK